MTGFEEGSSLEADEGCAVGQSDTDGCCVGLAVGSGKIGLNVGLISSDGCIDGLLVVGSDDCSLLGL